MQITIYSQILQKFYIYNFYLIEILKIYNLEQKLDKSTIFDAKLKFEPFVYNLQHLKGKNMIYNLQTFSPSHLQSTMKILFKSTIYNQISHPPPKPLRMLDTNMLMLACLPPLYECNKTLQQTNKPLNVILLLPCQVCHIYWRLCLSNIACS